MAGALGAPRWRIAYHLGLIEETAGRSDEARRLYQEAVRESGMGAGGIASQGAAGPKRAGDPATVIVVSGS